MQNAGTRIRDLILKYKEILLYLIFGGLTTLVSIGSYALLNSVLGVNELIANVISWVLAVSFAYWTNRTWVFPDKAHTRQGILKEMASFYGGRLLTLGIEEMIIFIFITLLHCNSILIKIIAQVVVVVLNYVISKLVVFRKRQ